MSVGQFARNCLHCYKPFHSYRSHLEILRHIVLASVNGVSSSCLLSEVLSAPALFNLFMQKKIADFSKLPFMLKTTLDHLNSIRGCDASWCTEAETAIWNLETEQQSKVVEDQQYGNPWPMWYSKLDLATLDNNTSSCLATTKLLI